MSAAPRQAGAAPAIEAQATTATIVFDLDGTLVHSAPDVMIDHFDALVGAVDSLLRYDVATP